MNLTANINEQLLIFLYAIALGVAFGVVYCALRIVKTLLGSGRIIEAVINLIYFPVCAIIFFFFVISVGGGEWRFYMILGIMLGAIIYILTLGRLLTEPVCKLITTIQKFLLKILRKIKGKIVKIDLKKKVLVLYNKLVYKRSTDYGTKSKGKKK